MDIQSIISSGILENYALGHCSESEKTELEGLLAQHPELRAELNAIENALEQYAASASVAPPAWMKGRILDAVRNLPGQTPQMKPSSGGLRSLRLVAASLATCLIVLSYGLWQSTSKSKQLESDLNAAQQTLTACQETSRNTDLLQRQVVFLRSPATHPITLKSDDASAIVYQNAQSLEVYLDVNSLPAPPAGKYYQCWAIVNSVPVSLGMVDWQSLQGLQPLGSVKDAVAFAVSIEDAPKGHDTPTQVYMVGKAG